MATRQDPLIMEIDAISVTAHSEEQGSAGTYKGGYGFTPMVASIDYGKENGTWEILAAEKLLMRTNSTEASREFLHHQHSPGLQSPISFALPVHNERFIHWINNQEHGARALDQHENQRHDAWVIDATKVIELKDYPEGAWLFLRAEPLRSGAQASLFDLDGHRMTAFPTNASRLTPHAST